MKRRPHGWWTKFQPHEDRLLRYLRSRGVPPRLMPRHFPGRTYKSLHNHMMRLGLTLRRMSRIHARYRPRAIVPREPKVAPRYIARAERQDIIFAFLLGGRRFEDRVAA